MSIQQSLNALVMSSIGGAAATVHAISKHHDAKEKAETKSIKRLEKKSSTQQDIVQGLAERFDMLSAKQKRQVLDVGYKIKKKVGAEDGK